MCVVIGRRELALKIFLLQPFLARSAKGLQKIYDLSKMPSSFVATRASERAARFLECCRRPHSLRMMLRAGSTPQARSAASAA